MRKAMRPSF